MDQPSTGLNYLSLQIFTEANCTTYVIKITACTLGDMFLIIAGFVVMFVKLIYSRMQNFDTGILFVSTKCNVACNSVITNLKLT